MGVRAENDEGASGFVNVSRRRSLSMMSMPSICSIIAEKRDTGLPKLFVGRHDHQRDVRDDTPQL